jgi:hypothetical protein
MGFIYSLTDHETFQKNSCVFERYLISIKEEGYYVYSVSVGYCLKNEVFLK